MTGKQRAVIRAAYLNGEDIGTVAAWADVTVPEAETYLRWWCDRGCPGAVTDADLERMWP